MQIIPAIDLRGGRCVRLAQGDYERETVFGDDPAAMARRWQDEGASRLHLVDLDGARDGRVINDEAVRAILQAVTIPCQLGGGVRDETTVAHWLDAGLQYVIVGTRAVAEPDWLRGLARAYPGRVILGLDARDGKLAMRGWLDDSDVDVLDYALAVQDEPLAGIIYTDIARDGMLTGPNLASTETLARRTKLPVYASGGVGTLDDVSRLAGLPIAGCIVGRALYEGRFRLCEARDRAGDRSQAPSSEVRPSPTR